MIYPTQLTDAFAAAMNISVTTGSPVALPKLSPQARTVVRKLKIQRNKTPGGRQNGSRGIWAARPNGRAKVS